MEGGRRLPATTSSASRMRFGRSIGLTGQYAAVDENLTGRENLEMVGRLLHLGRPTARARADELLATFDLAHAAGRPARTYSGGMRRRLDLAASLVGRPGVLFLDEPTTGLDPASRLGLWDVIASLVADGTTILLTTQYLEEADRLADRIAVIDGGLVIAEGTASQLKDRLGEDVVDLRVADPARTTEALELLRPLAATEPHADVASGRIGLPVHHGAGTLAEVVRRIDGAGLEVAELSLHRPSLDDVFLALTGRRAEIDSPGRRRRGDPGHEAPPLRPAGAEEGRMSAATTAAVRQPADRVRRSPTWIVTDSITIAWRNMLAVVRNPQLLVVDTITPIMFVLLFAVVFGGAIETPGVSYITFLMPGIFVQTVVFGGTSTAVGLAEDLQKGIIDRFRSLPMAPSAVLIGKTFADLLRNAYTVAIMTVVGFAIGFRFTGSVPEFLLALVLITLFGYSISWLSANIGLRAKSAQAAQGAIFIPVFPLTFLSSAFVPVATMPEWLQPIAEANPVTVVVNAARGLIVGAPNADTILLAGAWIVGLVAVFAPLAIWSYRRKG